jgi:hypothetical protein
VWLGAQSEMARHDPPLAGTGVAEQLRNRGRGVQVTVRHAAIGSSWSDERTSGRRSYAPPQRYSWRTSDRAIDPTAAVTSSLRDARHIHQNAFTSDQTFIQGNPYGRWANPCLGGCAKALVVP